jgi:3-phenylpropionate/trans-cinnamate dioxygenase ferredoxin subunit
MLTGDSILCTLHMSRFSLIDGEVIDPPAELPLAVYPVVVQAGRVLIEVADAPLEVNR